MSSSEEYLDNLLKNLLESQNNVGTETVSDESFSPETSFASTGDVSEERMPEENQNAPVAEANKAMSTDEIEEMLSSMGDGIVTGHFASEEQESVSLPDISGQQEAFGVEGLSNEHDSGEQFALEDWKLEESEPATWALEEDSLADGIDTEEDSELEDWALEEDNLAEEPDIWALEEDSLVEEVEPETWALEEDIPEEEEVVAAWTLEEDAQEAAPEAEEEAEPETPETWALEEDIPEEEEAVAAWTLEEDAQEAEPEAEEEAEPETPETWALEEDIPEEEEAVAAWTLEEDAQEAEPEAEEEAQPDIWASTDDILLEESEPKKWKLTESELPREPELIEEFDLEKWALEEEEETSETSEEEMTLKDVEEQNPHSAEELMSEGWKMSEDSAPAELTYEEEAEPDDWKIELESGSEQKDLQEESAPADLGMKAGEMLEEPEINEGITEEEDIVSDLMTEDEKTSGESGSLEIAGLDWENDDSEPAGVMSEEDINRLLGVDFAVEESGDNDEGLADLLAGMGHDEDLSEINDLLEKADRGLMEDDDMMALLDHPLEEAENGSDDFDFWGQEHAPEKEESRIREIVPPEAEEKSSKKKGKKKGKKNDRRKKRGESEDGGADTPKKQGAFSRLLEFLLEDEEDEDFQKQSADGIDDRELLGSLSDENRALMDELDAEDQKKAQKKKKDKKKKAKKGEKDAKKKAKAKKPKKPKKEKKPKAEDAGVPEKRISTTKIVFVVLFCTTIAVCILVVNMFMPDYLQKQDAKKMFEARQYEEVYDLLYGKQLNEKEEVMLQKSNIILQVQGRLRAYETYDGLGLQPDALNALIEGVERYQMFRAEAEQCGVMNEIDSIYAQILAELSDNYGLSESDALTILASEDDLSYSEKLYGVLNGTGIEDPAASAEEQPKIRQDVLPEEEEIIDRLENPDAAEEEPAADL